MNPKSSLNIFSHQGMWDFQFLFFLPFIVFNITLKVLCMCVCVWCIHVCAHIPWCLCINQRTACGNQFSASILWVPKLGLTQIMRLSPVKPPCCLLYNCIFAVSGTKPRASCMLVKHSTTKPHPKALFLYIIAQGENLRVYEIYDMNHFTFLWFPLIFIVS